MLSFFTAEIVEPGSGISHNVAAAHTLIKSEQERAGRFIDILTPRPGSRPAAPKFGWIIRELAERVTFEEAEDFLGKIGEVTRIEDPVPVEEVAKLIGSQGVAKVFTAPEEIVVAPEESIVAASETLFSPEATLDTPGGLMVPDATISLQSPNALVVPRALELVPAIRMAS
jgi:hypothetical protein